MEWGRARAGRGGRERSRLENRVLSAFCPHSVPILSPFSLCALRAFVANDLDAHGEGMLRRFRSISTVKRSTPKRLRLGGRLPRRESPHVVERAVAGAQGEAVLDGACDVLFGHTDRIDRLRTLRQVRGDGGHAQTIQD